ncbi:MAG TPA: SbcC/MukB-like Walker B domain-containing protein, partial [Lapillicoccus sp.]|nr:SbcC/MukB-like Walker B domain-containing protein [Lapillicoccus sp.]
VDAARVALAEADEALAGELGALARLESRRDALARLVPALEAELAALEPLVAEATRVRQLADLCCGSGANGLRMELSAFVLAARLEKVATLANERLRVMGDGRYQLAHSDDLAAGGRRSGLGLVVRDQWTGQVRDTASLSGGESFMASLALALGLADAVREEAGGFDLNTLFIDEGFGTLDDESLEQVMAVLDGLRDGGRCVGVVSHVSDLRSRVPAQVRVDKTSTGSSVTVLGLDNPAA